MTNYAVEEQLNALICAVEDMPDDTDIINAEVQVDANSSEMDKPIAKMHLHNANMEKLATYFHEDLHEEDYTDGYDILYFYKYGVKIFMLKERAAALSGTEDSGNEKDVT